MNYLAHETVETASNITASVIWLHGLGASGHDFIPIIPRLQLPEHLGIRFIFPHAPAIPITINNGMVMPGWYDIYALDMEREIDTPRIMASSKAIHDLIDREISRGIASDKIILAGFSQGGAVVLEAGLTYPKSLGALLSLSSYFATYKTIELHDANKAAPIHIYQGDHDDIVTPVMAHHAKHHLEQLGFHPTFRSYPMAHEVHPQQISDISQCLQSVLL